MWNSIIVHRKKKTVYAKMIKLTPPAMTAVKRTVMKKALNVDMKPSLNDNFAFNCRDPYKGHNQRKHSNACFGTDLDG